MQPLVDISTHSRDILRLWLCFVTTFVSCISLKFVSGFYDNTVWLWDACSGAHLITLKGHSTFMSAITQECLISRSNWSISADTLGHFIVICGNDVPHVQRRRVWPQPYVSVPGEVINGWHRTSNREDWTSVVEVAALCALCFAEYYSSSELGWLGHSHFPVCRLTRRLTRRRQRTQLDRGTSRNEIRQRRQMTHWLVL